ncbi:MAG: hypothetical protein AABZ15_12925 [Nitrospirota bacterium]
MQESSVLIKRKKVDYVLKWSGLILLAIIIALFAVLYGCVWKAAALPASLSLLVVSAFVLLGLGWPRWVGFDIRLERAADRKTRERTKWGFHGRDREGPWINYVDHPVVVGAKCARGKEKRFYSEWLIIHDGLIIVNPGKSRVKRENNVWKVTYNFAVRKTYAWDGCTPKRFFYWVAVVGAPDWWHAPQKIETIEFKDCAFSIEPKIPDPVWQIAHRASLIHDALYQYLDHHRIAKEDVDRLFHVMLLDSDVPGPIASCYHRAVKKWGPAREEGIDPVTGVYELTRPLSLKNAGTVVSYDV